MTTEKNHSNIYRADLSLKVLKYIGMWQPQFSSQTVLTIYNGFSFVVMLVTYIFTLTTVMYLFQVNPNLEDFADGIFCTFALLAGVIKIGNLFIKRDEITELTDMLLDKRFIPRDDIEICIQEKFNKISRTGTMFFLVIGSVTIIFNALFPLLKGFNVELPYKAWHPYNLENRLLFWLTYLLQAFGSFGVGEATLAIDTFVMVMMLQICSQLEILMHRMHRYPFLCSKWQYLDSQKEQEQVYLGMWIQAHETIYVFGDKLNAIYSLVFLFQLFTTTIDVCTSTYLLSTLCITSARYWAMFCSMFSIMIQILLYCWHGQIVLERSKTIGYAAYSTDWTLLSNSSKKSLIQIMRPSTKPMTFYAGWVAPVSIDTFCIILRMSYTLYNLLMQSS